MDVSVVLCTYNRCECLAKALESLSTQQVNGIRYEIVVVNNNSTDSTQQIIDSFVLRDSHFRCQFEEKQGLSYARNCGIDAARAPVIAFTDDDIVFPRDWIQSVYDAAIRYPAADFIGGQVVPVLDTPLPSWAKVTMAPFALQQYGDEPFTVDKSNPRFLIGACLIVRRSVFEKVGRFDPRTQRVKDGVGSTEDADWEARVWNSGGHGVYVPAVVCYSDIAKDRLTKAYHRRWHLGHGRFNARGRRSDFEIASRRILGIPAWFYRQTIEAALSVPIGYLKENPGEAFEQEAMLLFRLGYIWERWRAQLNIAKRAFRLSPNCNSPLKEPQLDATLHCRTDL